MSNTFNIRELNSQIQTYFDQARDILYDLHNYGYSSDRFEWTLAEQEDTNRLEYNIKKIYKSLIIILDAQKMHRVLDDLNSDFSKYEHVLTNHEYDNEHDFEKCDSLDCLWGYYQQLKVLFGNKSTLEEEIIIRIIKGLPRWFSDNEIHPTNENDIKTPFVRILKLVFPDVVTDFKITHRAINFQPDAGIKSLHTAFEIKFADTENEIKTAIQGLYEDIEGYNGSAEWELFYTIFYQTGHYLTEEELELLYNDVKAWKPILVTGIGNRKKKPEKDKKGS